MPDIYHEGNRDLQDEFDSRRLADRLTELIIHDTITDEDKEFIESLNMFFISTLDGDGRPTVSYKGGDPGFIKVLDDKTIAYPGYDGNGMYLTAGNLAANEDVGLLFISFESPQRLRLHGRATVDTNDPLLEDYVEAKYIVRIQVRNLFMNCARYIPQHQESEPSEYVPREGIETPAPEWKSYDIIKEVLPEDK